MEKQKDNGKTSKQIIERYTDQPAAMPRDLRDRIEAEWGGEPVQLYALADLDASMKLVKSWIALGPKKVAVASMNGGREVSIRVFERSSVTALREAPGLSCNVVNILGGPDDPPLATLRYTHRQRKAMENVKFMLEQQTLGHAVEPGDADEIYLESMSRDVLDAQASVMFNKSSVLWRLLGFLKPYKMRVTLGATGAVLLTLITLLPPRIIGYLIDDVIKPLQDGHLDIREASHVAWLLVAAVGVIYFLRQFFVWVRLRTMAVLGEYVARDLRSALYEHLQKLSLSFYSSKQTGSIISRVSSDTDRLWEFIALGSIDFVLAIVTLLCLGGVLLVLDWRLGLLMTLPTPLLFFAIYKYGERMHRICLRAWRKWSGVTEVLSDTIPGIRVVKAFNQEEREKKRFNAANWDAVDTIVRIHTNWTTFWPILWYAVHVMMLSVWFFALPRLLGDGTPGSQTLTIGLFVMFLLYMNMFIMPIEIVGRMTFVMNRATSSAHRVFEILDTRPKIESAAAPVRLAPVEGRVAFENVTFAYDGIRQIIRGVTFEVQPGEMVGLVGPSGGGKTTVVNLIARFYDVAGGRVLIDGVDVRDLELGHFRRQIGMVLQDPHLFHGTVLENIRYGLPDAKADQVVEAARAANAHDFICKLPHGYDTIVGERGHTLSGGERQRVSIARAILNNPRILILDEATSSVDTETERNIQEALERLISGRTVFAIAHRLSTLRRANRLFVIEEGRIAEQGTHAELLASEDGTYRKLHNMQQELHEMFAV